MSWKLAKDYNNPMWGPRPLKIRGSRPLRFLRSLKPLKSLRPLKPLAPLGNKYIWKDDK